MCVNFRPIGPNSLGSFACGLQSCCLIPASVKLRANLHGRNLLDTPGSIPLTRVSAVSALTIESVTEELMNLRGKTRGLLVVCALTLAATPAPAQQPTPAAREQ